MEVEVGFGPTRAPQYQRATGGRLPEWYVRQPPSVRGDEFFLIAFAYLGTERAIFVNANGAVCGTGPLQWSRAILYAKEAGLDRRTRRWFAAVMLSLDSQWRESKREENDKERRKADRKAEREARKAQGASGIEKRRRSA
jgi:hypothetical protein